jgi:hypothetical protein
LSPGIRRGFGRRHCGAQTRIVVGIASAFAGRDGKFADYFREDLASFRILGRFMVFD